MKSEFKDLGVGVGLRPPHMSRFIKGKPETVSWVEVITENFLAWKDGSALQSQRTLQQVRQNVPIALHGVSLSAGSVDPLDKNYLIRLKELIRNVEPIWISDHLCWTGVGGTNLHDLLPLPYTEEAVSVAVKNISHVQEFLGRRMLIENVSSYVEFEHSEMKEWEFLTEVARRADCGILLDINNVYVSAFNHGFDPLDYLSALPKERIGQIHLAGHSHNGTHLVDTHDAPVSDQVWALYRWVTEHFPLVSTMIERDGNIPEWSDLEKELLRIGEIRRKVDEENSTRRLAASL